MLGVSGSSFQYLEESKQRSDSRVFIITIIFEAFTLTDAEEVLS